MKSLKKENEKTKHIPVVILSTSSSISDVNSTFTNNANSFISKPSDINDFFQTINSLSTYWFETCKLPDFK